jgi:hypothetical protein
MRSGYDAIYGIFTVLLILTVLLHVCIPNPKSTTEEKRITVSVTKIKGAPQ